MKNPILRLLAISWRLRRHFIALCAIQLFTNHFALNTKAQAPQRLSYQAEIRNASNALVVNTLVGMRFSIMQGSATGTAVYVERQTPTTNANGLVSLQIGGGTVISGVFANISWGSGTYFLKTETDPAGGTNYTISGTQQMLSVPYALYANNANTATTATTATSATTATTAANGVPTGGTEGQVLTRCNGILHLSGDFRRASPDTKILPVLCPESIAKCSSFYALVGGVTNKISGVYFVDQKTICPESCAAETQDDQYARDSVPGCIHQFLDFF
jgi:hypothetical protein